MQDQPRRLRSTAVSLGLVGALALSLSACGTPSASATRRCIDETNIRVTDNAYPVVPDAQCLASPAGGTGGSFGATSRYRYYYGGTLNNNYVSGGSFTIPTTRSGSSSSRRWYNPGTWRSSSSSNTSTTSSSSSSSTKSGVSTGGFGSSGSSGGKSGSSSS
jgi:hypothetical protein